MKPNENITQLDIAFGPKNIAEFLPAMGSIPKEFLKILTRGITGSDSGVEIAYTPTYNGDKTEQLANARLIAVAPEMLKVLQLAIAKRNSEYEIYMKMKAIVAKAIGE